MGIVQLCRCSGSFTSALQVLVQRTASKLCIKKSGGGANCTTLYQTPSTPAATIASASTMATPVQDISALELARLLRAGATDVKVVDVRDLDRAGGHIRGSVNIHADDFVHGVEKFAKDLAPGTRVVFHCMFSQQRGPRCARALAYEVGNQKFENPPKVYVLTGGFRAFASEAQFHDLLDEFHSVRY